MKDFAQELDNITAEHKGLRDQMMVMDATFVDKYRGLLPGKERVEALLIYTNNRSQVEYNLYELEQRRLEVVREMLTSYHLVPKEKECFKLCVLQIRLEEPGLKKKKKARLQRKLDKIKNKIT